MALKSWTKQFYKNKEYLLKIETQLNAVSLRQNYILNVTT